MSLKGASMPSPQRRGQCAFPSSWNWACHRPCARFQSADQPGAQAAARTDRNAAVPARRDDQLACLTATMVMRNALSAMRCFLKTENGEPESSQKFSRLHISENSIAGPCRPQLPQNGTRHKHLAASRKGISPCARMLLLPPGGRDHVPVRT